MNSNRMGDLDRRVSGLAGQNRHGMGDPDRRVSGLAGKETPNEITKQITREYLLEQGVPPHLVDVPWNEQLAVQEVQRHLEAGIESFHAAGGWLTYMNSYLQNRFIEVCERSNFDMRIIQVAGALYHESLKHSSTGLRSGTRRRRIGGSILPPLGQVGMTFQGEKSEPVTSTLAELTNELHIQRQGNTRLNAELEIETNKRTRAEKKASELALALDSIKNLARGESWPELTDRDELKIAEYLKSNLERFVSAREVVHIYAARIRQAPDISEQLKHTVRNVALLINMHSRAAELDLLSAIGMANPVDANILSDEADATQDSFNPPPGFQGGTKGGLPQDDSPHRSPGGTQGGLPNTDSPPNKNHQGDSVSPPPAEQGGTKGGLPQDGAPDSLLDGSPNMTAIFPKDK